MATAVKMPQLSDTMSSGKILTWSKQEGQSVTRGEILAEVETDKANLEIESFQAGTLLKIVIPANSVAQVGEVIAYIGEAGEAVPADGASTTAPKAVPVEVKVSAPTSSAPPAKSPPAATASAVPEIKVQVDSGGRLKASPLAKKIAAERNIDLTLIRGSGPNGRIVRRDLEKFDGGAAKSSMAQAVAQPVAAVPMTEPRSWRELDQNAGMLAPMSKMRETIARRMEEAIQKTPHFYTTISIDMDQVLRLREVLKEKTTYQGISVNHFVVKAAAYGLKNEPRVNCAFRDGQIFEPGHINIGVITAVEDGLLIPVLRDADKMTLAELVAEARSTVQRAKAGRPSGHDLTGGTFSISNMGMFDVDNFTAIINPGQGAVLAVAAIKDQAVVVDGEIVPGKRMRATISVDHRIIDGLMAANFLKFFKEGLQSPALLMGAS